MAGGVNPSNITIFSCISYESMHFCYAYDVLKLISVWTLLCWWFGFRNQLQGVVLILIVVQIVKKINSVISCCIFHNTILTYIMEISTNMRIVAPFHRPDLENLDISMHEVQKVFVFTIIVLFIWFYNFLACLCCGDDCCLIFSYKIKWFVWKWWIFYVIRLWYIHLLN